MFGRAIWDKLPESISENFEIVRVKREMQLPKNAPLTKKKSYTTCPEDSMS